MKQRKLSRATLAALLVCVTMLAVSCAPAAQPPATPGTTATPAAQPADKDASPQGQPTDAQAAGGGEMGEIKFLHIYPEHQKTIDKSIEIIEGHNPGLKVTQTVVPWNEATKTIQTAQQSGDMYDVFFQWSSQVPGYDQVGLLFDLTPYLNADAAWKDGFLNQEALGQYMSGDKIMGVPLRGTGVFLIYNKTLFDENAWQIPATQEELVTLMDTILAKGGITPIEAPGKPNGFQMESARGRIFDHIVYMAGRIEDPLRLTDRVTEWDGLYAKSAELMKDWYKKGYFGQSPFGIEREEAQTVFFTGKAAMLLCNNNELIALRQMNEETANYELGSFMWPAPAGCEETLFTAAGFGDGWGAWKDTKYPDAVVAFMKGISTKEVATYWANDEKCVVAVGGIEYTDPLQASFAEQFARSGKYKVTADYNTGNLGDLRGQAFVDYMTSDSMTAEELETKIEELTRRAIEDAEE